MPITCSPRRYLVSYSSKGNSPWAAKDDSERLLLPLPVSNWLDFLLLGRRKRPLCSL